MRIYRYVSERGGSQPRVAAAAAGAEPVDIADALAHFSKPGSPRIDALQISTIIEMGPNVWQTLEAVALGAAEQGSFLVAEDPGIRWLCPFDRLASLKDFLAFEDHVKRGAARRGGEVPAYWYEAPIYYKGNHRALLGPDDECAWPPYTEHLDFELELAMVVGKGGRDLTAESAEEYIFGFTVFNDFSARDIQAQEISAWLGPAKGKDFANAFGPCIVTADEVGTEPDLDMICRVNGGEWGRARSSEMKWKWADILAHVSMSEDVHPADVFGSGTPGGCCGLDLGRKLQPGDVVELEIEKIGILRNTIGLR